MASPASIHYHCLKIAFLNERQFALKYNHFTKHTAYSLDSCVKGNRIAARPVKSTIFSV
jgi:hypothetical protein